jgi:signal transduction histidine kinase
MSVTSVEGRATSGAADRDEKSRTGAARLWAIGAVVAVAAILSGFYGINQYAAGTGTVVKAANDDAGDFESVFGDLMKARFRFLEVAADVLLQDSLLVEAFTKGDRAALVARAEPLFEQLQKKHGLDQLNLYMPPAKVYFRGGKPDELGMDVSKYRPTLVAASERQKTIMAVETGVGGQVDVRAIVPLLSEGKFAGLLELASNFDAPLERASETAELSWAVGITRESSERSGRPPDTKSDVWQKDYVFFHYSDPGTAQIVRSIKFDPQDKAFALLSERGRTIFVKTFPVIDFSGAPAITIAVLRDVTDPFGAVLRTALAKALVLFLAISAAGAFAFVRFGQIRERLTGVVGRQRRELAERVAFCDAAVASLKDVDLIKRGFFTNLVTALNEPLQAIAGQLAALAPAVGKTGDRDASDRLNFVLAETSRLSHLIEDYKQVELFRQKLVKNDSPLISLATVVATAVEEDLAVYRRLPQFTIAMAVPADLPPTRADAGLLRRAVGNLVGFAAQSSGHGRIAISGAQDAQGWLVLTIAGSAFEGAAAPTEALLDESRQFLARLAGGDSAGALGEASRGIAGNAPGGALVGVVLARIIVEFYGGTLSISDGEQPGFAVRLPAAA